jgi:hypothetical protein
MDFIVVLIILFIIAIVALLFFRIIIRIVDVVLVILALLAVGLLVMGILAYADLSDLQANYPSKDSMFIFLNNNRITYATVAKGFDLTHPKDLTVLQTSDMQSKLDKNDLVSMQGSYYKIVFVDEVSMAKPRVEGIRQFNSTSLRPVIAGVKGGWAVIYPDSMFFQFVKYTPGFLLNIMLVSR